VGVEQVVVNGSYAMNMRVNLWENLKNMSKRTTTPEELERWAERVATAGKSLKDNPQAFQKKINDFFDVKGMTPNQRKTFQKEVVPLAMKRLKMGKLHKDAGGHDLKADRRRNARIITNSPERYKELGATRSDLSGYDTKNGKVMKSRNDLNIVATAKGKTVFAREVTVNGKKKYRNRQGRFVKRKG